MRWRSSARRLANSAGPRAEHIRVLETATASDTLKLENLLGPRRSASSSQVPGTPIAASGHSAAEALPLPVESIAAASNSPQAPSC